MAQKSKAELEEFNNDNFQLNETNDIEGDVHNEMNQHFIDSFVHVSDAFSIKTATINAAGVTQVNDNLWYHEINHNLGRDIIATCLYAPDGTEVPRINNSWYPKRNGVAQNSTRIYLSWEPEADYTFYYA